jgi:hypothetical protein
MKKDAECYKQNNYFWTLKKHGNFFGNFLFSQGGGFGTSPTTAGVGSSNSNFLSGSTGGVGASNIGCFGTICAIFSTGSTG